MNSNDLPLASTPSQLGETTQNRADELGTEHPWRVRDSDRSVSHQVLWLVSDQKNAEVSGIQRPLPILDPSLTLPL